MPEEPTVNIPPDVSTFDAVTRWMLFVNTEEPMSEDAQIACDLIRAIIGNGRELRAFWHSSYNQWWIHPKSNPGCQVGCVFEDAIEAEKARRATLP